MTPARVVLVAIAAAVAIAAGALRPVCRPLSAEDLSRLEMPIEQRTDRDMYYLPVFQQRDGRWYHCKTWLSRQLFF